MPRALIIQRTVVPADGRVGYLEQARRREAHYANCGCQYWVFEDGESPGVFVEFAEARDEPTLSAARASAPDASGAAAPVYRQVTWPA